MYSESSSNLLENAKKLRVKCAKLGENAAAERIADAIESFSKEGFVLSVMGAVNRGKSTLVNAILGEKLAPVDYIPTTSIIARYEWAENETPEIEVRFSDGKKKKIDGNELADYITEEKNGRNAKSVSEVTVRGRFNDRVRNLTLIDLPGTGSGLRMHDEIVYKTIPESDAVILLSDALEPFSRREVEMLTALRTNKIEKVFFPINKGDYFDPDAEELKQIKENNKSVLEECGEKNVRDFPVISAKNALEEGKWEESGLKAFWDELYEYVGNESERGKIKKSRFVSRVRQAGTPVSESLEKQIEVAKMSAEQMEAEIEKNRRARAAVQEKLKSFEGEFESEWRSRIETFKNVELPNVCDEIFEELGAEPTEEKIEGVFEAYAGDAFGKLNNDLREIANRFSDNVVKGADLSLSLGQLDLSFGLGDWFSVARKWFMGCAKSVLPEGGIAALKGDLMDTLMGFGKALLGNLFKIGDDIAERRLEKAREQIPEVLKNAAERFERFYPRVAQEIQERLKARFDNLETAINTGREKLSGNEVELRKAESALAEIKPLIKEIGE